MAEKLAIKALDYFDPTLDVKGKDNYAIIVIGIGVSTSALLPGHPAPSVQCTLTRPAGCPAETALGAGDGKAGAPVCGRSSSCGRSECS